MGKMVRNGVDYTGLNVFANGVFIDTSNMITSASIPANTDVTYTATRDCAVVVTLISAANNDGKAFIDDTAVYNQWCTSVFTHQFTLYVKKGQVCKFRQTYTSQNGGYVVYGIQQGTCFPAPMIESYVATITTSEYGWYLPIKDKYGNPLTKNDTILSIDILTPNSTYYYTFTNPIAYGSGDQQWIAKLINGSNNTVVQSAVQLQVRVTYIKGITND